MKESLDSVSEIIDAGWDISDFYQKPNCRHYDFQDGYCSLSAMGAVDCPPTCGQYAPFKMSIKCFFGLHRFVTYYDIWHGEGWKQKCVLCGKEK